MVFPAFRKNMHHSGVMGILWGILWVLSLGMAQPGAAAAPERPVPDDLPQARAGECFARMMIPAQYETRYEDVVVDEGGSRINVSDARFAAQTKPFLVRAAAVRYAVRQPVYKAVHEKVMVRPGYERLGVEPAQYRTVTEQVVVTPARTAWKPGKSLADWSGVKTTRNNHGEVYCLVEIPAETKAVSKRVLIRAETVGSIFVPPVYRTITRQVLVDPGGVQEIPLQAHYASLTTQHLIQRAEQHSVAIAPTTQTLAHRSIIAPERYAWIRVLCKTNATPAAISSVQTQLQTFGYYHGPVDGQLGLSTQNAVRDYQHAVGIPHGGYLSLDTISALNEGRRQLVRTAVGAEARASASASVSQNNTFLQRDPTSRLPSGEMPNPIASRRDRPASHNPVSKRRLHWAGKS